mgnify:CR=1
MQFVILALLAVAAIFLLPHLLAAIGKIVIWVAIICVLLFLIPILIKSLKKVNENNPTKQDDVVIDVPPVGENKNKMNMF